MRDAEQQRNHPGVAGAPLASPAQNEQAVLTLKEEDITKCMGLSLAMVLVPGLGCFSIFNLLFVSPLLLTQHSLPSLANGKYSANDINDITTMIALSGFGGGLALWAWLYMGPMHELFRDAATDLNMGSEAGIWHALLAMQLAGLTALAIVIAASLTAVLAVSLKKRVETYQDNAPPAVQAMMTSLSSLIKLALLGAVGMGAVFTPGLGVLFCMGLMNFMPYLVANWTLRQLGHNPPSFGDVPIGPQQCQQNQFFQAVLVFSALGPILWVLSFAEKDIFDVFRDATTDFYPDQPERFQVLVAWQFAGLVVSGIIMTASFVLSMAYGLLTRATTPIDEEQQLPLSQSAASTGSSSHWSSVRTWLPFSQGALTQSNDRRMAVLS